jgi:hypothetical protein
MASSGAAGAPWTPPDYKTITLSDSQPSKEKCKDGKHSYRGHNWIIYLLVGNERSALEDRPLDGTSERTPNGSNLPPDRCQRDGREVTRSNDTARDQNRTSSTSLAWTVDAFRRTGPCWGSVSGWIVGRRGGRQGWAAVIDRSIERWTTDVTSD